MCKKKEEKKSESKKKKRKKRKNPGNATKCGTNGSDVVTVCVSLCDDCRGQMEMMAATNGGGGLASLMSRGAER